MTCHDVRVWSTARNTVFVSMSSFDEYLATVSAPQKAELERIRRLVRRTVPDAEEATSYGMPAFKYKKRLLGFQVSTNHLSVFLFSPEAIDAARDALVGSTSRKEQSASHQTS